MALKIHSFQRLTFSCVRDIIAVRDISEVISMQDTSWLEDFDVTRQDIMEDAFLLDALSQYISGDGEFTCGERAEYFPQVFRRLSGYLSQHALELHNLEKRMGAQ